MTENILKSKNIVFLGLTQNSDLTLKYFLNFYKKIKKKYKNCYLIIGENGSIDKTKNILTKLSRNDKNFFLINTDFVENYKFRLEKMSNLREKVSKQIKFIKKEIDFVCWFDLDDVIKDSLSTKKFCKSNLKLINDSKLFGVSANSKPFYYDILSFRMKNFFTKNIYYISLNKNILQGYLLRKKYIYDMQIKISNSKNLFTISSFNGMCIYHYKYFKLGSYLDKKKIIRSQVEHVTFNNKIHKKTKKYIYVDKNFLLKLPDEHRLYKNFIQFCFGKAYFYLLKLFNL